MPVSPDAYLEERKAEILAAARAVFIRHGFERATMQEIADEVGLSAGAIYRYFPSKESLITIVCASTGAENMRAFEEYEDGDGALDLLIQGGREVWAGLLDADALDTARINVEATVAAMRHPETIGEPLREEMNGVREHIAAVVRRAQSEGSIDPAVDAAALGSLLLAMTLGTQMLMVQMSGDVDADAIWQLTTRMVRGFGPAAQR